MFNFYNPYNNSLTTCLNKNINFFIFFTKADIKVKNKAEYTKKVN